MGYRPTVSMITVCLNGGRYVEGAIKSICEQSYPNIEYIVVDGGSIDGSIEVFNKYRSKIDKFIIEEDSGIFDAMNKGIKLASGDIIHFLNSDDRLYDNEIVNQVVSVFADNSEVDFVYGNVVVHDPVAKVSYIEKYPEKISKSLFIKKTITQQATFFRSSCFRKAGYFDEKYKIASDYEWYLRAIFKKGLKGIHIKNNISVFKLGGISTDAENLKLYLFERDSIQRKYFNNLELLRARFLLYVKKILGRKLCKRLHAARTHYERF